MRVQKGCIRQRSPGATFTAYWFTTDSLGRRRQWSRGGFRTRGEARQHLHRVLNEIAEGRHVEPSRETFGVFMSRWLEGRRDQIREKTSASYKELIESYIIPEVGHLPLQQLRPTDLSSFYGMLRERGRKRGGGLSLRTVRYIHSIIGRALRDAERWGLLPRNVARLVDPPGTGTAERPCWNVDEAQRFLSATANERLGVLWRLAIESGCRRGELLGLEWDDLGDTGLHVRRALIEVGRELQLTAPKSARGLRFVPLDGAMLLVLRSHKARQAAERLAAGEGWQATPLGLDLIFRDELGAALRPQRVLRAFQAASRRAGVPVVPLHALRHLSAVLHARAGTPRTVAAEILGHDVRMLESVYQRHAQPDLAADAVRRIAATLHGG